MSLSKSLPLSGPVSSWVLSRTDSLICGAQRGHYRYFFSVCVARGGAVLCIIGWFSNIPVLSLLDVRTPAPFMTTRNVSRYR